MAYFKKPFEEEQGLNFDFGLLGFLIFNDIPGITKDGTLLLKNKDYKIIQDAYEEYKKKERDDKTK